MSFSFQRKIALALLVLTTLSGCNTTARLNQAASEQGRIKAGVNLPDYPSDCKELEAHAELLSGAEIRSILARERAALDRQNSRTTRCAEFYADIRSKYGKN